MTGPDRRVTPDAWRAIALGVLVGGLVGGMRAASGRRASTPLALAAAVVAGSVIPIARASRRPPVPQGAPPLDPAATPVTFSVVVAGRDEANVLPALVRDVAGQDWRDEDGEPRFELVVIDDRSIDGTGAAVLDAATRAGIGAVTRVIRREGEGLPDGKGAALTAAQPDACRGDYVVVLDADARIGSGFLRVLAGYAAAGVDAMTPRRRILDAGSSVLAQLQADEQTLDGELQRGRWAMDGCSEFRGNGITIRRSLLTALGGWHAEALTEDIDLSSRLAAETGIVVAWILDAEVWEEPVRSWKSLLRQRERWSEGAARRAFEHGPAIMASRRLSPRQKADFALYVAQLLAPPLIIGAALGTARRRPVSAAMLLGTYMVISGGITWDALRWERDASGLPPAPGPRVGRAVGAGVFTFVWLAAVPRALWRLATRTGHVRYDKMAHHGSSAGTALDPSDDHAADDPERTVG